MITYHVQKDADTAKIRHPLWLKMISPSSKRRSVYHPQDQNPANFKKLRPFLGMSQWISFGESR
jgi:hypothetical protein